jgi:hypothetical protein
LKASRPFCKLSSLFPAIISNTLLLRFIIWMGYTQQHWFWHSICMVNAPLDCFCSAYDVTVSSDSSVRQGTV